MSDTIYSSNDHPEHMNWINAAVDAMLADLKKAGPSGVPLSKLLRDGIDAVPGDTGPRGYPFIPPGCDNLYLAGDLPIWGLATWGHLMDRCRDSLEVQAGTLALLTYHTDGAPMANLPIAKSMRSYARPHWLPLLIIWKG